MPDLAIGTLDLDAALFDFSTSAGSRRSSSLLSPSTALTEPSQVSPRDFVGGLDISSSSVGGPVDISGFNFQGDEGQGVIGTRPSELLRRDEEEALLPEPDFAIDADGNLIEFSAEEQAPHLAARSRRLPSTPQHRLASEIIGIAPAHLVHEERRSVQVSGHQDVWDHAKSWKGDIEFPQPMEEDVQVPAFDDYVLPSDAQPFSVAMAPRTQAVQPSSSVPAEELEESSSTVQVLQRRRRQPKPLPTDSILELRNTDLARWNAEYLTNMQNAREAKEAARSSRQAKQNAETWVIGRGLGNVGWGFGRDHLVTNPILADLFSGEGLWEGVTGIKRRREAEGEEVDEGEGLGPDDRRVRARSDEDELIGRGEPMELDEAFRLPAGEEDVELAREAPSALDARMSDTMPWNITASLRHSSVPRSAGAGPFAAIGGPSSAGGGRPPSVGPIPGSLDRRSRSRAGSRIVSASPLVGRGLGLHPELDPSLAAAAAATTTQEEEEPVRFFDEDLPAFSTSDIGPGVGFQTYGEEGEFELYGPGAAVDTQTAAQSQWVRTALDVESGNFLEFVRAGVRGRIQDQEQYIGVEEEETDVRAEDVQVLFEELLPPERNTRVVAASGLLHVLSLASRGLVKVKQEAAFSNIEISIVGEL